MTMPPAISDLFPPKARAVIYTLSVMLAPAYVVAEANTALHWGWVAAYGAWTGLVGALAAANTSKPDEGHQAAGGDEVA